VSPLLEINGVYKNFGGVIALDGVDLSVETGSLTCLIGPNGCGKTTLFNVVSGAFRPTAGRVRYGGDDITGLPPYRIARRGIARKFQVPGIYPSLSVSENLEVAVASRMTARQRLAATRKRHGTLNDFLHLAHLDGKALVPAAELAHGEKQWLEIAMLMACDPDLILLDEPTAGMTIAETQRTADLVLRISRESGKTILVIEHDMHFVRRLACRVVVMMRGKVFRDGSYEQVQADPEVRKAYLGEVETC
jgi:urea ABC transporter ATP-binding protein UrtD